MFNQIQNRHRVLLTGVLTVATFIVPMPAQQQQPQYPPPPQGQYPDQQAAYPPQQQVNYPPQELDRLVARIALYPDPLLAQIFAAATYPDQIQDAANWSDQHHYLTGDALARAITNDQLYFDPSVQALLPFPSVLQMMAADMGWTASLGNAFLSQGPMLEDAVQRLRQQANQGGYLRSNNQIVVRNTGNYIEIAPYDPGYVVVPYYDPNIFYGPYGRRPVISFGFGVRLGAFFGSWGWGGGNRFLWDRHEVYLNNSPWQRRWDNRVEYHHPYEVRSYARPGFGDRGPAGPMPNRDFGRDRAPVVQPQTNRDFGRGPAPVPQPQTNRDFGRDRGPAAAAPAPRPAPGQAENHTLRPRDDRERSAPQNGGRPVETHRDDARRNERKQ